MPADAGLRARLARRANLLDRIRGYFRDTGALEVTTPVLVPYATLEPTIENFSVSGSAGMLRTSPESALKQRLAAGAGDLFEIGPVFRAGEHGQRHRQEFTLLEWYRLGRDHHALMDDVAALLRACGFARSIARLSYAELFGAAFGTSPHDLADAELRALAAPLPGLPNDLAGADRAQLFDYLYAGALEREAAARGAVFLYGYPVVHRAYARLSDDTPPVAERFELLVDGLELANAYHEITDADEQRACFAAENALRRSRGLAPRPVDADWLVALERGLPACAGVALGIERLLMMLVGATDITAV